MQAIEVVTVLFFAIVMAGLIIAFITGFDFNSIYKFVNNIINPQPSYDYVKEVDMYGFAQTASNCWKDCAYGQNDKNCGAVLLKRTTEYPQISPSIVKSFLEKINICPNCNVLLPPGSQELPRVVSIKCEAKALKIE